MQLDHPWHAYEGLQVTIALVDGSVLRDCVLISVGRGRVRTLWIITEGADMFIRDTDVAEICCARSSRTTGQAA
jgi:hypothetical protein